LADNHYQPLALTLDGLRSAGRYEHFLDFLEDMIKNGVVNRADDDVPTRHELLGNPAKDRGIPRPLLCVLLGLTKHWAAASAVKTAFIDRDTGRPFLDAYFPERLRAGFVEQFPKHPLRREIIATTTVNYAIN